MGLGGWRRRRPCPHQSHQPRHRFSHLPESRPATIQRSDQGGFRGTWVQKSNGITWGTGNFYIPMVMDPNNGARLLVGLDRVYETVNSGDTWTAKSRPGVNGFTIQGDIDSIGIAPSSTNTVYVVGGGEVFVTNNFNAATPNWTETIPVNNPDRPVLEMNDIIVDPLDANVAYLVIARFDNHVGTGNRQVYMTTNAGGTWTNISGSLPNLPAWSIEIDNKGTASRTDDVLFVGNDDGVYSLTNPVSSTAWTRLATGMPRVQVTDLEWNNTYKVLAAGTHGRGAWQLFLG